MNFQVTIIGPLVTRFFINLAKTFAHCKCVRACARSSVIVVLASGATTFWQNSTTFKAGFTFHLILTQKIFLRCQESFPSCGAILCGHFGVFTFLSSFVKYTALHRLLRCLIQVLWTSIPGGTHQFLQQASQSYVSYKT